MLKMLSEANCKCCSARLPLRFQKANTINTLPQRSAKKSPKTKTEPLLRLEILCFAVPDQYLHLRYILPLSVFVRCDFLSHSHKPEPAFLMQPYTARVLTADS